MERFQRSEFFPNRYQSADINGRSLNNKSNNVTMSYCGRKNDHDCNESNRSQGTTGESTEVEEDEEQPDDDRDTDEQSQLNCNQSDQHRRSMVCGLCHLAPGAIGVTGVSASPGPMFTCTRGHLLCQQCVHRYTVCSDVGCVVCGAELYASQSTYNHRVTSGSGSRNRDLNSSQENTRGVEADRKTRTLAPVQESDQSKNWVRNYDENKVNGVNFNAGNSHRVTGYSSGWEGDSGDAYFQLKNIQTNANHLPRQLQQHQTRSYCSIRAGDNTDFEPELQRIGSGPREVTGNLECSRRPIRCPRLDCAVNVAFSALTHHFLFDHPEVPILSVEPGIKSTLIVSFAALSCDSSRCLALLLVSGKLMGTASRLFNGSQIQPRYRNRLPLPVLAARIHCTNKNPCHDQNHNHGEGRGQGDVVIAWVAGLDVGGSTARKLRCSIEAVDGTEDGELRSLTYTGPVNSLRTAQRPHEVFRTGDCVILHQGLINHITSGSSTLNVNVIVH